MDAGRSPTRTLVRGLVLSGATAEPVGLRSVPYRALAWAMDRLDGPGLDALNAWFFRTRYEPAIAEPIIDGGLLVERRRDGPAGARVASGSRRGSRRTTARR